MLDLAFLAVAIFVIVKANKGEYNETACNIALVVGVIAGAVGCVIGIMANQALFVVLNIIVIVGAFGLRFVARRFVDLYVEQQVAETERLEQEMRSHARFSDPDRNPIYTDDTFDDEELRFGKGGYTDRYKVSLDKKEIYSKRDQDNAEPLFGKKVSLEKKKLPPDKDNRL